MLMKDKLMKYDLVNANLVLQLFVALYRHCLNLYTWAGQTQCLTLFVVTMVMDSG
jgi:hypothetical protein